MSLTAGQEVTVTHDGSTVTAKARSETVAELLERLHITPSPLEMVAVDLDEDSAELTIASELTYYDQVEEPATYETVRVALSLIHIFHAGGPLNPLKTEGVPQQVPRLNRQARGLFFCVGFMSPICYFFYFFSRLLHSSTALFFCKVGDITPVSYTHLCRPAGPEA